MQDVLNKILAILEAQDAKIKALEAELKAYTDGTDTLLDTIYMDKDAEYYQGFSDRHRSKFEPYLGIMDKLEGEDAFRKLYNSTNDLSGSEGFDEEAYVSEVLANTIETINSLKAVVPPEAQAALEVAEEAIAEAAVEAQEPVVEEVIKEPVVEEEAEIEDSAPDDWSEAELEKEKMEGRRMFE